MRSVLALAVVAAQLPVALCDFSMFQFMEMDKRQAPGSSNYECHYDCGYAIIGSREDAGYCSNSSWVELYDECMDCAIVEDIWSDYGPYISPAASSCGLTPVPSPATAAANATGAAGNSTVVAATRTPTTGATATAGGSATASAGATGAATGASSAATASSSATSGSNKHLSAGATLLFGLVSSGLAVYLL